MSKQGAANWLWAIAIFNLGVGAILSIFNWIRIESDELSLGEAAEASVWLGIGGNLWGFGVMVFVVLMATTAIVEAIERRVA